MWSNREQHAKAEGYLVRAEHCYHDAVAYRAANPKGTLPLCNADVWDKIEEKHTVSAAVTHRRIPRLLHAMH